MKVDTDGEEKEKRRKCTMVLLTGLSEATNSENIEDSYPSVRSQFTEEEESIHFPYWKEVG